jgi:hypothetical protein
VDAGLEEYARYLDAVSERFTTEYELSAAIKVCCGSLCEIGDGRFYKKSSVVSRWQMLSVL